MLSLGYKVVIQLKSMQINEKEIIVNYPQNRPYLFQFSIVLEKGSNFPFEGDYSLIIENERLISLSKRSDDNYKQGQSWIFKIEAFKTASEAESFTLKLIQGVLWSSIKNKYGLRLLYNSSLPFEINNRASKVGSSFSISAELSIIYSAINIIEPISDIIKSATPIDSKLLIACELFTSARLESTERAKFVGLVSSLEPLCEQNDYGIPDLSEKIKQLKEIIEKTKYDEKIKNSLLGRIEGLKKESVSQSIKRTIEAYFPNDKETVDTILDAYNTRSKILYEGLVDPDLNIKSYKVEEIVRQILEKKIIEIYLKK